MALPSDIQQYVSNSFGKADAEKAFEALAAVKGLDGATPEPRLLRCALVAGGNSLNELLRQIEALTLDARDVIVAAEYERLGGELVRVRNLSNSFGE